MQMLMEHSLILSLSRTQIAHWVRRNKCSLLGAPFRASAPDPFASISILREQGPFSTFPRIVITYVEALICVSAADQSWGLVSEFQASLLREALDGSHDASKCRVDVPVSEAALFFAITPAPHVPRRLPDGDIIGKTELGGF